MSPAAQRFCEKCPPPEANFPGHRQAQRQPLPHDAGFRRGEKCLARRRRLQLLQGAQQRAIREFADGTATTPLGPHGRWPNARLPSVAVVAFGRRMDGRPPRWRETRLRSLTGDGIWYNQGVWNAAERRIWKGKKRGVGAFISPIRRAWQCVRSVAAGRAGCPGVAVWTATARGRRQRIMKGGGRVGRQYPSRRSE